MLVTATFLDREGDMIFFVPNHKLDILVTATLLTLKSGILVVCKIDLSSYQYNGREIGVLHQKRKCFHMKTLP